VAVSAPLGEGGRRVAVNRNEAVSICKMPLKWRLQLKIRLVPFALECLLRISVAIRGIAEIR
jgi:hypothetical protein